MANKIWTRKSAEKEQPWVAMRQGEVLYYIFGDHLGSTAVVKNMQGGKTELRYTAWGSTRYEYGSTPTDRRFTGQREEASLGLYFYNARWYDPALGRFIQADTIVPGVGNPQAWDRYAYVSNNPIKYIDPTGHYCVVDEDKDGNIIKANCESGEIIKNKYDQEKTIFEKALNGDVLAILDLLFPSHAGVRIQAEGTLFFFSVSVGANAIYNRVDDRFAGNVDWSLEGGLGFGAGVSATAGPLLGWASSNIEDSTSGNSAIMSASAAAETAGEVSISLPLERTLSGLTGLHVDPKYGQVPFTLYGGAGKGGAYADAGGGLSGTWVCADISYLLPWHWSFWK